MKATKTIDTRISPLLDLFDMHTTFFDSVIDGISDEDAHNRLNTKANHVAWLTGSLVQQRFDLAKMFGLTNVKQHAHELFKDNKGIQESITYPPLAQFSEDWKIITPVVKEALIKAAIEKLDSLFKMPGMEYTYYQIVNFSMYREANCIGQIALWRRLLGYEPMKYM